MPGGWEWLIIIAVLLLLFGAKRLPDMARSVGQSARVFKGEMKGLKDDGKHEGSAAEAPAEPAAAAPPAPLPAAQPPTAAAQPPTAAAQPPVPAAQPAMHKPEPTPAGSTDAGQ